MKINKLILSLLALVMMAGTLSAKDYAGTHFGIKADGLTDNTRSIQYAIDFISKEGGGKLTLFVGRYICSTIYMRDNVTLVMGGGSALVSPATAHDYDIVNGKSAVVIFDGVKNASFIGRGLIEGNNPTVSRAVKVQAEKGYREGVMPATIYVKDSENIKLQGVGLNNSCATSVVVENSKNVDMEKVTVNNLKSDAAALEISSCDNFKAIDCYFDTKIAPIVSAGTSKGITFTNCLTPTGKTVSVSK
ncbi:MAG: hypothetical protein E7085_02405 [Parabacteroides distasonis]|nr:hypothetical protein [Parabacteroides distasonis]